MYVYMHIHQRQAGGAHGRGHRDHAAHLQGCVWQAGRPVQTHPEEVRTCRDGGRGQAHGRHRGGVQAGRGRLHQISQRPAHR